MSWVSRLLYAGVVAVLALAPISASATPSPSPGLDTVLATPPTGYTELTSSPFHGSFTAHEYAQASDSPKAKEIEDTMNHEGFVAGYGKTWVHQQTGHALIEAVLAFKGAKGAKEWLLAAEAGDKADPTYKHANTISGISPYYGGHFQESSTSQGDVFSFAKGNDVFIVGAVSPSDDVLDMVTTQTRLQYSSAPKETIPSSQWPENQNSGGTSFAYLLGRSVIPLVVILALVVVAVGVIRNRRRGATTTAMAGVAGGTAGAVQMSNDGNYWWDGQTWRDAAHEVPPSAQRSGDGALWWDGQTWRPVPQAAPPSEPTPPPTA
jgi:hypothetical protein